MNTEEQARERMAQQRQHGEHLQESMLRRAEGEANSPANTSTEEHARQQMAQQRHESEHVQESMLSRAEAEVGIPSDGADSPQAQS